MPTKTQNIMTTLINQIESKLTSLGLDFSFSGESYSNGTSIYYNVSLPNNDKFFKVRFSGHSISNLHRLQNEVSIAINNLQKCENYLLGSIGHPSYTYGPVEFKNTTIEVLELKKGQKAISTRITKKGNKLFTIEINKPVKFGYTKK